MQTKLVYVLTCAEEATYIEQALMSIWSARYHNENAYIVLLVDDKTDELLVNNRAEILQYITEKKVIKFADSNLSMMYRSRYIKTQVRTLINGDFIFIDSDTIINHSLSEIDDIPFDVAAVPESNLPIERFHPMLYKPLCENAQKIGWNPIGEEFYYSSGIIYVKDTPNTHRLFKLWHKYWNYGLEKGISIDQPSLGRANIECGHIIQKIDNKWNCIMFTYPRNAKNAYILHFASFRNMSFLFSKRVLGYIKENGLTNYIKEYILNPTHSYIPFNCEFYYYNLNDYINRFKILYKGIKDYANHIDPTFIDYLPQNIVFRLLNKKVYFIAVAILLFNKWKIINLTKKYTYTENICEK